MADEQNQKTVEETPELVEEVTVDETAARIQELEEQLAVAKDQALRAAADVQNMRRRAEQDVEKARKFSLERFANDLLPVLDSLERGFELCPTENPETASMREGMELTIKLFIDTLARHQLVVLNPEGEPFNPEHHQAMAMEESAAAEPNSVLKVFQKGYLLSGRLLRPAMVVVSKAPTASA